MDTVLEKGPPAPTYPKRRKVDEPLYMKDNFTPKTNDYAKVARAYEKYNNDNNTFNGKSLSDARPLSNFYQMKSKGADAVYTKAPIVRGIEKDKK